jgi:hypothetical protein
MYKLKKTNIKKIKPYYLEHMLSNYIFQFIQMLTELLPLRNIKFSNI